MAPLIQAISFLVQNLAIPLLSQALITINALFLPWDDRRGYCQVIENSSTFL